MAVQTPHFTTFENAFGGDLVTPTHPQYESAIARWALNAQRRASIVAFVKHEADVVLAIKFARDNALPIAVRGGGHNSAGTSSSENGLVIDLSRYITAVRVDQEKKVIHVGGGALWRDVDHEAIKFGMATVGGTVNHVSVWSPMLHVNSLKVGPQTGVGGLILGGGFGFLTGEHGLTIDNLVQATVITADGSILTADDNENPDLFWAIRGGGSNFGVVTEFVLKLHPQRRTVFAGSLIFAPHCLEQIVSATTEWWPKAGEKEAVFHVSTVLPDGNPALALMLFYNGSESEGRTNFKAFFDIGPIMDMMREMPYEEVNTLQNVHSVPGRGRFMKGVAPRGPPHYTSIARAQALATEITKSPTPEEFRISVGFEYVPMGKVASLPRSATAYRRGATPNVLIMTMWVNDGKDSIDKAREYSNTIAEILVGKQADKEQGLGYANYDPDGAGLDTPEVRVEKSKVVFAENYPRLQEIKKRYDPKSIFNKWFPITPAS